MRDRWINGIFQLCQPVGIKMACWWSGTNISTVAVSAKSVANGFHGIVTLTEAAAWLGAAASDALEGYFVFPPCHHAIAVLQAQWQRNI